MSEDPTNGHPEVDRRRRYTETVQSELILESVVDAAPYPPDWRERPLGVDFFYRENTLLVRTWNLDDVRRMLTRVIAGIDVRSVDVRGSCTRLRWAGGGEDAVFVALAAIEEELGHGVAAPEHLLYVCGHSCRAKEPDTVDADAPPSPRPQVGEDAADPRCRHGKGTTVLVLDTGLVENAAEDHWWLAGVTGDLESTFVPAPDGTPTNQFVPDAGHGTGTAACVRVTAPEADVRVVDAVTTLDRNLLPGGAPGQEVEGAAVGAQWELDLADIIRAELAHDVPDVLLVNFAAFSQGDDPMLGFTSVYDDVIRHLKELLIVAPAGNDHDERKLWPASFSWVVSVGGLAANWRDLATWTSRGRTVDVYAPGEDIVSAFATGDYTVTWDEAHKGEIRSFAGMASTSGTSLSAPFVAGLVASRASTTGQSSRRAWADLLELAERQAIAGRDGVPYPVLYPGQGCGTTTRGCC